MRSCAYRGNAARIHRMLHAPRVGHAVGKFQGYGEYVFESVQRRDRAMRRARQDDEEVGDWVVLGGEGQERRGEAGDLI